MKQFAALCTTMFLLAGGIAIAQPQASPAPSPTPKTALTYSGNVRAFYFTRSNEVQNAGNPNRYAFNVGGKLHAEYAFTNSPISIGASYFGAYPFGTNGANPQYNAKIDNTLPGFSLSTLGEAYAVYRSKKLAAKIGNQVIDTPWANPSDSRLKPVAFQGLAASVAIGSGFTLAFDRMIAFEGRTSSAFDRSTLLTSRPAGNPAYPVHSTGGFLLGSLGYARGKTFAATLYDYQFYDIANMLYARGTYRLHPSSTSAPFLAVQFISERQTGRALVGAIDDATFGLQAGMTVARGLDFSLGFDHAPWRSATITAPSCAFAGKGYFLPAGGTPDCRNNENGTYTIYYGGIASPYTEAYATDPLFTTTISQGMTDRHSAGDSFKAAAAFTTLNKRVKLIVAAAWYNYGNGAGPNQTREFNADAQYFFNKVTAGRYHGFSFRERYADRTQPTLPYDFKYNRTQLEYDF